MKKIISIILAFIMVMGCLPIAFADGTSRAIVDSGECGLTENDIVSWTVYDERQNFVQNDDLIFNLITQFGNQKGDLKQYKLNQIKTGDSFISIISYPLHAILTTFAAFGVISAYVFAALIRYLNVKLFDLLNINQG